MSISLIFFFLFVQCYHSRKSIWCRKGKTCLSFFQLSPPSRTCWWCRQAARIIAVKVLDHKGQVFIFELSIKVLLKEIHHMLSRQPTKRPLYVLRDLLFSSFKSLKMFFFFFFQLSVSLPWNGLGNKSSSLSDLQSSTFPFMENLRLPLINTPLESVFLIIKDSVFILLTKPIF